MKKKTICIVMALLCLKFYANGQALRLLNIGDKVPVELLKTNFITISKDAKVKRITLGELQKSLVIIDFWASWCGPCLKSLHNLEAIQKHFADSLYVLPVTFEDSLTVVKTLDKKQIALFSGFGNLNSLLKKYFPHQYIPHQVWIKNGIVSAITSDTEANYENLFKAIRENKFVEKTKIDLDLSRPLFSELSLNEDNLRYYSLLLNENYPGLPSGVNYRQCDSTIFGISVTNSSLRYLFQLAAKVDKKLLIRDSTDLNLSVYHDDPEWLKRYLYSYELRVPTNQAKNLYKIMLDQLNLISGYNAHFSQQPFKCLSLKKLKAFKASSNGTTKQNIVDKSGILHLKNASGNDLISRLNDVLSPLVIDETGIHDSLDITLPLDATNFDSIKQILSKNGLSLEYTIRDMEVLVIDKIN